MHVLITGGYGFIAAHTAARLAANPNITRITMVVSKPLTTKFYTQDEFDLRMSRWQYLTSFDRSSVFKRIDRYQCDLTSHEQCEWMFIDLPTVDVIVHLAGITGARPQPNEWTRYMDNVSMVQNLLLTKPTSCSNFIFTSSSSVYNKTDTMPFREDNVIVPPRGMYAQTKQIGEQLINIAAAGDIHTNYVILRPFTVFGPLGRPDMLIPRLVDSTITGEPVIVDHQGLQVRDFTPVEVVASAIENLIMNPIDWAKSPLTMNVAYGECRSVNEVIRTITEYAETGPNVQYPDISTSYIDNSHASVSRMINYAGPVDRPTFADAIRKMIDPMFPTTNN